MLKRLNLQKYINNFQDAGITTLETLDKLNDNDLKDKIGIHLLGPRRKITTAIEKLRVTRYLINTSLASLTRLIPKYVTI